MSVRFLYDLPLPTNDVVLAPNDDEAQSFELMDKDNVLSHIYANEFKPNCTLGTP